MSDVLIEEHLPSTSSVDSASDDSSDDSFDIESDNWNLTSQLCHLPLELWVHILSFASHKDICNAALVCKHWYSLATSDAVWQSYAVRNWGVQTSTVKDTTWLSFVQTTLGVIERLDQTQAERLKNNIKNPSRGELKSMKT